MKATIILDRKKHYPVLLNEIISIITPQYGGTFIDCTFGQGGYTKKILNYSSTKVIGIDRDEESFSELNKSGASESTPNSFKSLFVSSS